MWRPSYRNFPCYFTPCFAALFSFFFGHPKASCCSPDDGPLVYRGSWKTADDTWPAFQSEQTRFCSVSTHEKNILSDTLSIIRNTAFRATQASGLADNRASIVGRRDHCLHPLSEKLSEDIWALANCLASNRPINASALCTGMETPYQSS